MNSRRRSRVGKRVRKAFLVAVGLAVGVAVAAVALRARSPRGVPAAVPGCRTGTVTPGIDVSYYQQTIDWPKVRRAGIRFAFIRVSDGATLRDTMFATNWAEARRAGVVRGAYQFFRPDQSAVAQADLMIAAMHDLARDDLPPVLDLEIDGGLPTPTLVARAQVWLDRVREKLGVEPILYTGNDLWRNGGAEPLATQSLWIAHYTSGCPMLPSPWTRWTFWQHTDRGAVPGIEGPVDLDLFAGTLSNLRTLR
jgi:lysozyme